MIPVLMLSLYLQCIPRNNTDLPPWTKYVEVSEKMKQNWTRGNFEICFCVNFNYYYQKFISIYFYCFLLATSRVFSNTFLFSKIYICVGVSWFGNVMTCTLSSKMDEREHSLFFYHASPPLNLKTVNLLTPTFSSCVPSPLKNIKFFSEPS